MDMKKKSNCSLITVLTVLYVMFLVWLILLKLSKPSEIMMMEHRRTIYLIPFHYDVNTSNHLEEVAYNIIVFIPFAIYLKMLGMRS